MVLIKEEKERRGEERKRSERIRKENDKDLFFKLYKNFNFYKIKIKSV